MSVAELQNDCVYTPIPEERLTTLVRKPAEQFSYWRDLVSPVADVAPGDPAQKGFHAAFRGHDLGKINIASMHIDAVQYRRTRRHITHSGLEHWQLLLRKTGYETCHTACGVLRSSAGSLDLRSHAIACEADSSEGDLISIWLSRDHFAEMAEVLDAFSHQPIQGPMRNILQEFILTLDRHRSSLTRKEIPAVVTSLGALLHAAIRPTRDGLAAAAAPIQASLFEMARKYIDANLASPGLSAQSLCKTLGTSRRKLYYLFEPKGGVARFIRERRLAACHAALENMTDSRLISTIAYEYGFTDPAKFSHLFRTRYGYSPREAREALAQDNVPLQNTPANFTQWLLHL